MIIPLSALPSTASRTVLETAIERFGGQEVGRLVGGPDDGMPITVDPDIAWGSVPSEGFRTAAEAVNLLREPGSHFYRGAVVVRVDDRYVPMFASPNRATSYVSTHPALVAVFAMDATDPMPARGAHAVSG